MPHYLRCHTFNGLHGRALPAATGIKVANPGLLVIAEGGDGDMYGEGGNHFVHTIRRNPDITNIVHNNMVYGLTKGQASPTSARGFRTPVQVDGVLLEPFNPVAVAIALNASLVARTCTVDPPGMRMILKQAMQHPGYALVDILHPCVSFNKLTTSQWFRENTYRWRMITIRLKGRRPSGGLSKQSDCRWGSSTSIQPGSRCSKRACRCIDRTTSLSPRGVLT